MINWFTESFDNWEIGTMRRKKQTNKQTIKEFGKDWDETNLKWTTGKICVINNY